MRNVTFVGTEHRETGRCSAEALAQILRDLDPEVVFEEIRPTDVEWFYEHGATLEVKAVKQYRKGKTIQQVPVDRYDLPDDLKSNLETIFGYVEDVSPECWMLKDDIEKKVHDLGFSYLNSDDHARKWASIDEIQDRTVLQSGHSGMIRILRMWRDNQRTREREMVQNIYRFTRGSKYSNGVFLVGASHKPGISRVIQSIGVPDANLIDWRFFSE